MDDRFKAHYKARVGAAMLFRSYLSAADNRVRLLADLGTDELPVIIPALGDTRAADIESAALKHFASGESMVLVPVGLVSSVDDEVELWLLRVSTQRRSSFWELDSNEIHSDATMAEVVQALDPGKKWEIEELDGELQQTFKQLAKVG